jgi:hypothetical protein
MDGGDRRSDSGAVDVVVRALPVRVAVRIGGGHADRTVVAFVALVGNAGRQWKVM